LLYFLLSNNNTILSKIIFIYFYQLHFIILRFALMHYYIIAFIFVCYSLHYMLLKER